MRQFFLFFGVLGIFSLITISHVSATPYYTIAAAGISYNGGPTGDPNDSSTDQSYTGDLVTAEVNKQNPNMHAEAKAYIYNQTVLKAMASASDSVFDKYTANAWGEASSKIYLQVTNPGTITFPLFYNATLSLGIDPNGELGFGKAYVSLASQIWLRKHNQWYEVQTVSGSAKLTYDTWYHPTKIIQTTTGILNEETVTNGSATYSGSTIMQATLTEAGTYSLIYKLSTSANTGDHFGGYNGDTALSDAFNSFGTHDFWNAVSGTASFYDIDDPSHTYSPGSNPVPEPATMCLVALGLFFIGRIKQEKIQNKT